MMTVVMIGDDDYDYDHDCDKNDIRVVLCLTERVKDSVFHLLIILILIKMMLR